MLSLSDLSLCDLVAIALATYRVTRFVTHDDGPGCVLVRLRHLVGVRYDERGRPTARDGSLAKLAVCFPCASCYVAAAMMVLYCVPFGWLLLIPLAAAGGAVLLDEII